MAKKYKNGIYIFFLAFAICTALFVFQYNAKYSLISKDEAPTDTLVDPINAISEITTNTQETHSEKPNEATGFLEIETRTSSTSLETVTSISATCNFPKNHTTYGMAYGHDAESGYIITLPESGCIKIVGSDGSTFHYLGGTYVADKNSVYFYDNVSDKISKLSNTPEKFVIIEPTYLLSKDLEHVYLDDSALSGIDARTFSLVKTYDTRLFAVDEFFVYSFYKTWDSAEKILNALHSTSTKGITTIGYETSISQIPDADPQSFRLIDQYYAKDKDTVFYLNNASSSLVIGADARTFSTSSFSSFYQDQSHLYYSGEQLAYGNPESIKQYGTSNYYNIDGTVYFFDYLQRDFSVLQNADTATFKGGLYGTDKNNAFYGSQKINGVEIDSFEIIDYRYAKDKNHVYMGAEIVTNVDTTNFVPPGFPCFEC